ncbi:hypothetical protein ACA910_009670 [Epithemia clementina (nom. ined.)]
MYQDDDDRKNRRLATRDALVEAFEDDQIDQSANGVWHEIFYDQPPESACMENPQSGRDSSDEAIERKSHVAFTVSIRIEDEVPFFVENQRK